MKHETIGGRVRARRRELKLSQAKLSALSGISQPTISDIENDVTVEPRKIASLAAGLQMSVEALLQGIAAPVASESDPLATSNVSYIAPVGYILVKGEVSAGVWRAMSEEDAFKSYEIPIAEDPRYPKKSLFGLIVRGTSVNNHASDGDVAVCLDVWAAPRPHQHDDLVVVRRTRIGQHETTIKRVRWHGGELRLFTDSSDPRFDNAAPLDAETDPETDVQIVGFALYFMKLATRF